MTLNKSSKIDPKLAIYHNHLHLTDVLELSEPRILVDLDNTLCGFKWSGVQNYNPLEILPPIMGRVDLCHRLFEEGFILELFTARLNIVSYWIPEEDRTIGFHEIRNAIENWLKLYNFPSFKIPSQPRTNKQKRGCLAVIDDNCINPLFCDNNMIFDFCISQRLNFVKGLALNKCADPFKGSL